MLRELSAWGVHLHDQVLGQLRASSLPVNACTIAHAMQHGEPGEFTCDDVFDILLHLREEGLVNFTFPPEGPRLRPYYTWFALPDPAIPRGRHHMPGT